MTARRPNILVAVADDASHFSCYGHRFVRTPVIDALAAQGLLFRQAFTTNPKCAPSRASMLTGRHTWQNREACQHWCRWPVDLPTYPDLLAAAGYHVGFTGKGWGPGDFRACGRLHNPAGPAFNQRRQAPPTGTGISDNDYAANFADFLADRRKDQPFCFWFGCHEPHRHYVPGEGLRHGLRLPDPDEVPPYWPNDDIVRSDMADYALEIEWFDRQLGRILDHLRQAGTLDDTVIIITSDNGCPFPRVKGQMYDDDFRLPLVIAWPQGLVGGGRAVDGLISFIDLAPTLLELAGLPALPEMAGRSLVDILHGAAGDDRRRACMGRERHDVGSEGDLGYPVRCLRTPTHLYVRNLAPDRWPAGNPETNFTNCDGGPTKDRILALHRQGVSRYWHLAFGKRPAEELYDITVDPFCLVNLIDRADLATLAASLRDELTALLHATGDPRIQGQGDWFEQVAYVGKTTHSWARYLAGTWQPQDY